MPPLRKLALVPAIVVMTAMPGAVQALQILQQNFDFELADSHGSTVNVPSGAVNFVDSFVAPVNRFDPALGTLESVTILYFGTYLSEARARFFDPDILSEVAGRVSLSNLGVVLDLPGLDASETFRDTPDRAATCSATGGLFDGATCTAILLSEFPALPPLATRISGALLDEYLGVGTFDLTVDLRGRLVADETDGDDGFVDNWSGLVQSPGEIEIRYVYTPALLVVAEPATLGILGFGLGALGIAMARRKAARRAG